MKTTVIAGYCIHATAGSSLLKDFCGTAIRLMQQSGRTNLSEAAAKYPTRRALLKPTGQRQMRLFTSNAPANICALAWILCSEALRSPEFVQRWPKSWWVRNLRRSRRLNPSNMKQHQTTFKTQLRPPVLVSLLSASICRLRN